MSCKVKDKGDGFSIHFDNLTKGEVYALINALRIARNVSTVASDLSSYLSGGFSNYRGSAAREFSSLLSEDIDLRIVPKEN